MGKVKVEVFIPMGACGCTFANFMDRVWNVLMKYRDSIDYTTRSIKSPEADKYKIIGMSIVVNGSVKFPPDFDEEDLEQTIKKFLNDDKNITTHPTG